MKLRNFSPVVISLLVGAALGYCLGPVSSPAPAPEPEKKAEPEQVKQPEYRGERADRALRARIKELEDMIAKQGIEVEKMKEGRRRGGIGDRGTGTSARTWSVSRRRSPSATRR